MTSGAWRAWWGPRAGSYYFIGKDNVVFHTVVWPAMLIGYQGSICRQTFPPTSTSPSAGPRHRSRWAWGARSAGTPRLQPDAIRYAIASVLPEQSDTDLSDEEIIRRINDELVATWGNLVNRVLTLVHRHFEGRVPAPSDLDDADTALLDE